MQDRTYKFLFFIGISISIGSLTGCSNPPSNGSKGTPVSAKLPHTPLPKLLSIDQIRGPTTGNVTIRVTGENLDQEATLTIGGKPCLSSTFSNIGDSIHQIDCLVPPGTPGYATIKITSTDSTSDELATPFEYVDENSVNPKDSRENSGNQSVVRPPLQTVTRQIETEIKDKNVDDTNHKTPPRIITTPVTTPVTTTGPVIPPAPKKKTPRVAAIPNIKEEDDKKRIMDIKATLNEIIPNIPVSDKIVNYVLVNERNSTEGQDMPGLFGPEWTFSDKTTVEHYAHYVAQPDFKIKYSKVRLSLMNARVIAYRDKIDSKCFDLKVPCRIQVYSKVDGPIADSDHHIEGFKVIFDDGFWFSAERDEAVIEVNSKPSTYNEFNKKRRILQDFVFDTLAQLNLKPHPNLAGGHIHMDIPSNFGSARVLRNFVVDAENHPLVYARCFVRGFSNPPIALDTSDKAREEFTQILLEFDDRTLNDPGLSEPIKILDLANRLRNLERYSPIEIPETDSVVGFERYWANRKKAFNLNHLGVVHKMGDTPTEKNTLEIRAFSAQESMDQFLAQLQMLEGRARLVRHQMGTIAYIPRVFKLKHLENFKVALDLPNDQVAIDECYKYISEAGLEWNKMKKMLRYKALKTIIPTEITDQIKTEAVTMMLTFSAKVSRDYHGSFNLEDSKKKLIENFHYEPRHFRQWDQSTSQDREALSTELLGDSFGKSDADVILLGASQICKTLEQRCKESGIEPSFLKEILPKTFLSCL